MQLRPDLLPELRHRIFIYALAATSLNLILGYGGMISFGHAPSSAPAPTSPAFCSRKRRERMDRLAGAVAAASWRAGDRRGFAAHARRVLHHDYARVRADGVLLVNSMKAYGATRPELHERASVDWASIWAAILRSITSRSQRWQPASKPASARAFALRTVIQAIRENEERARRLAFRCTAASRLLRIAGAPADSPAHSSRPRQVREPERAALDAVGHAHDDGDMGGAGRLWAG